jgi:hypothetical protein
MFTTFINALLLITLTLLFQNAIPLYADDLPPKVLSQKASKQQSSIETIRGKIIDIKRIPLDAPTDGGIHITLKTKKGDYTVHLGPKWIRPIHDNLNLAPGDDVMVMGMSFRFGEQRKIDAHDIKKK